MLAEVAEIVAEAAEIVAEAAEIVAEVAAIVAEVAVIVAEAAVIVAEAAVIVVEALVPTGEEDQVVSHHAVVHRALEGRCLFVVVLQAPASGEVGRAMSTRAYSCKSNTQGSKRVSYEHTLTPT